MYKVYIGIMENKMETTIVEYILASISHGFIKMHVPSSHCLTKLPLNIYIEGSACEM